MSKDLHKDLKSLGSGSTVYSFDKPDASLLEKFLSPSADPERNPSGAEMNLHIETNEFSSLCPLTGQPDWATIVVDYIPNKFCLESKSWKLYLNGYRNFGEFHESCITRAANDLIALLDPNWIRVVGRFAARGGIPFWPTVEYTRSGYAKK